MNVKTWGNYISKTKRLNQGKVWEMAKIHHRSLPCQYTRLMQPNFPTPVFSKWKTTPPCKPGAGHVTCFSQWDADRGLKCAWACHLCEWPVNEPGGCEAQRRESQLCCLRPRPRRTASPARRTAWSTHRCVRKTESRFEATRFWGAGGLLYCNR